MLFTKEHEDDLKIVMDRCVRVHGEKICFRLYWYMRKDIRETDIARATRLSRWIVRYWIMKFKKILG